jgi:hypothetical protein
MKNLNLLNSKLENSAMLNSSISKSPNDFQKPDIQKKVELPKPLKTVKTMVVKSKPIE